MSSHIHCSECGYENLESAHYCSRCGAFLRSELLEENTVVLAPGALDGPLAPPGERRAAVTLVVRSGGGREGETFERIGDQTLIGRSPECDIFLDDVTVSRRHAEIGRAGDGWMIRDLGSLNGTFLNRRRIDESPIEADDEVQIGKYRLTFLTP